MIRRRAPVVTMILIALWTAFTTWDLIRIVPATSSQIGLTRTAHAPAMPVEHIRGSRLETGRRFSGSIAFVETAVHSPAPVFVVRLSNPSQLVGAQFVSPLRM